MLNDRGKGPLRPQKEEAMKETKTVTLANGTEVELYRDGFDVTAYVWGTGEGADFDLMFSYAHAEAWAASQGATPEEAEAFYDLLNDMDYRAQDGE